jgi:hypothetical protein
MMTLSDYGEAKRLLVEYISRRDDIVTAWQYGEVSQPGVSDLDMMVLIKDKGDHGLNDYLMKDKLPPLVLKALAHANVIILPESSAYGVFYWDDVTCTDIKTKKPVNVPLLNVEYLRIAMLVDWYFERTYRIYSMKHHGCSNKQLMLGMMKSYGYCVENFQSLAPGVDFNQYFTLKKRLLELRNSWLEMESVNKHKVLENLFDDYYLLASDYHEVVFEWINNLDYYPEWSDNESEVTFHFPDGNVFHFCNRFSNEIKFHNDNPMIMLPEKLLHHFTLYANQSCQLSNKLGKSFRPQLPECQSMSVDWESEYKEFLYKRINFASSWYDCLKDNSFTYGLFKFGWYLNA